MEELSKKLETLEKKLEMLLKATEEDKEIRKNNTSIINNNFEIIANNFQVLNEKVDALYATKVDNLHTDTEKNFKDVKFELVKIQKITSYDEMYENLKIVGK